MVMARFKEIDRKTKTSVEWNPHIANITNPLRRTIAALLPAVNPEMVHKSEDGSRRWFRTMITSDKYPTLSASVHIGHNTPNNTYDVSLFIIRLKGQIHSHEIFTIHPDRIEYEKAGSARLLTIRDDKDLINNLRGIVRDVQKQNK